MKNIFNSIKKCEIPTSAKLFVIVVFGFEIFFIVSGKTLYPFSEVGVFKKASSYQKFSNVLLTPKYFYWDKQGQLKLIELKNKSFLRPSAFDDDFIFASMYRYFSTPASFEILVGKLEKDLRYKPQLLLGIQQVEFSTGLVSFETNADGIYRQGGQLRRFYVPEYRVPVEYDDAR